MPPRPLPLASSIESTVRRPRRRAVAMLLALPLALALPAARADVVDVTGAELRVEDDRLVLNAEFAVTLNATLEEALQRGIPLYFVQEFELTRPRWYWVDEKVAHASTTWRVSYTPLTRQYRIASGLLSQSVETLQEVERIIGRITSRTVARASDVVPGARYEAGVRLRLDVNQLPKPFQVNALASREWQLASEWLRWSFTP